METITTIGLDIAKSVFQVHGVDGKAAPGCVKTHSLAKRENKIPQRIIEPGQRLPRLRARTQDGGPPSR